MSGIVPLKSVSGKYVLTVPDPVIVAKPPVIPPGQGTPIAKLSDLSSVWSPTHLGPSVNANLKMITTPSGPGWEMICNDNAIAPWDSNCKAIFARIDSTAEVLGTTEIYTFDLYLPNQKLTNIWHTGLLIEWHTANSSGHYLGLDMQTGTPRFRIARNADNYTYQYITGPVVQWDRWIPVRIEIKWSLGGDGIYRVDLDGQRIVDFKGATAFPNDGALYVQYGWYARRGGGLTNTVRFGDMRVQRT